MHLFGEVFNDGSAHHPHAYNQVVLDEVRAYANYVSTSYFYNDIHPEPGWQVLAYSAAGSAGGTSTMHYWPHYDNHMEHARTTVAYPATNQVMIGRSMSGDCGNSKTQVIVKYFSIEEGIKTQTEIETLVVNNPALTISCGYFQNAFELSQESIVDQIGGQLTLTVSGPPTTSGDGLGVATSN